MTILVTPQVRHPERVFLREGSPECGMIELVEKTLEKLCGYDQMGG